MPFDDRLQADLKGVCAFRRPETIRITIDGRLPAGVFAKDVILHVIGTIGVGGATGKVIEFDGPVVQAMSMEARMTLCNMAVEAGATCGICAPDRTTAEYLWPHIKDRFDSPQQAAADWQAFCPDPDAVYADHLVLDVSSLEPLTTWGYKPDQVKPVAELAGTPVDQVYIGSCTNGRIEDLRVAARVLAGKKVHPRVRAIVAPATADIYARAVDEGLVQVFVDAGVCVTNPTCGACLGMSNGVLAAGEVCAATTNRNFNGRMGAGGMIHLVSPATAAATAVAGHLANSELYEGAR